MLLYEYERPEHRLALLAQRSVDLCLNHLACVDLLPCSCTLLVMDAPHDLRAAREPEAAEVLLEVVSVPAMVTDYAALTDIPVGPLFFLLLGVLLDLHDHHKMHIKRIQGRRDRG